MGRRLPLPLLLAAALAPLAPARVRGEEVALVDAPLCLDEIRARGGGEVEALRAAEAERWRAARRAGRAHRRSLRDHLAPGTRGARELMEEVDRASEVYFAAVREAQALCRCRLRRGAAEPAECERRYPVW
jgi:hypothetical protein